ncbi:MAG TPA: peptidylprolyl isomerase [Deltaproteobacteria bacterium]|nr:peptidylprolyl isomerase [Deltaproteobacteria bacterium]
MRLTLSQPPALPGRASGRPRCRRWTAVGRSGIRLGLLAAFVGLGGACNRVDLAAPNAADPRDAAVSESSADPAGPGDEFVWPEDPSHPILSISVESERADGTIAIELMPELAPVTVARVIELAKEGYYDGTTFHRVIPGFMIQGGDPNSRDRDPSNDGMGGSDLRLNDEFTRAPFVRGVVGMGNTGQPNTSGSQFFIMHDDNRSLDGRYTVIGRVISGMETVDAITRVPIDRIGRWGPRDRPMENVVMKRVAIQERVAGERTTSTARREEGADEATDLPSRGSG